MNATFGWLVGATWQASCLAVLVFVTQTLVGGRLSSRARCVLWMVVVARLVMPPLPSVRWSFFHAPTPSRAETRVEPAQAVPAVVASTVASSFEVPVVVSSPPTFRRPVTSVDPQRVADLRAQLALMNDPPPAALPATAPPVPRVVALPTVPVQVATPLWPRVRRVLPVVWAFGVVVALARILLANVRLARTIRRLPSLVDADVNELLLRCAREMQLRRTPRLLSADHLAGPALAGFVRPTLLLPRTVLDSFSAAELRLMFLHELAHVRRRDVAANWLLAVLTAVHWFNPVLWLTFRRLRADRELACDELVLSVDGALPDAGHRYGHTLLRLADWLAERRGPRAAFTGAVGILDDSRELQRRIVMISRFNPTLRRWPALCAGGALLIAGVALTDAAEPATRPARSILPSTDAAASTRAAGPARRTEAPATAPTESRVSVRQLLEERLAARKAAFDAAREHLEHKRKEFEAGLVNATDAEISDLTAKKADAQLKVTDAEMDLAKNAGEAAPLNLTLGDVGVDGGGQPLAARKLKEMQARGEALDRTLKLLQQRYDAGVTTFEALVNAKSAVAEARAEVAEFELTLIKRPVAQQSLDLAVREASIEADLKQKDVQRIERLVGNGVATNAELDKARAEAAYADAEVAKARLEAGRYTASLKLVDQLTDVQIGMLDATMAAKNLAVDQAQRELTEAAQTFWQGHPRVEGAKARLEAATKSVRDYSAAWRALQGKLAEAQGPPESHVTGRQPSSQQPAAGLPAMDNAVTLQDAEAERLDAETLRKLAKPVKLSFGAAVDFNTTRKRPLSDWTQELGQQVGVNFLVEYPVLRGAGFETDAVELALDQPVPASQLLDLALRRLGDGRTHVGYTIDRGTVVISTTDDLARFAVTRVYDVSDLSGHPGDQELPALVSAVVDPGSWREAGGRVGVIRQFRSKLLVTQSQQNQGEVAKLLTLLRTNAASTPRVGEGRSQAALKEEAWKHLQQMLLAVQLYDQQNAHMPHRGFEDGGLQNLMSVPANFNPRLPDLRYGYRWVAPDVARLSDVKDPAHTPLICEVSPQPDGSALVGFVDGHIEDLPAAELGKLKLKATFGPGTAVEQPPGPPVRDAVKEADTARDRSAAIIRRTLTATIAFQREYGRLPASLDEVRQVLNEDINTNPRFSYLAHGYRWAVPANSPWLTWQDVADPAHTPLVEEAVPQADGTELVGYADGHVVEVRAEEAAAQMAKALKESREAVADVRVAPGESVKVPKAIAKECQEIADQFDRKRIKDVNGQVINEIDVRAAIDQAIAAKVAAWKSKVGAQ